MSCVACVCGRRLLHRSRYQIFVRPISSHLDHQKVHRGCVLPDVYKRRSVCRFPAVTGRRVYFTERRRGAAVGSWVDSWVTSWMIWSTFIFASSQSSIYYFGSSTVASNSTSKYYVHVRYTYSMPASEAVTIRTVNLPAIKSHHHKCFRGFCEDACCFDVLGAPAKHIHRLLYLVPYPAPNLRSHYMIRPFTRTSEVGT
jgi:hypothetical protein